MKIGFEPISINEFVKLHLKNNPGTKKQEITKQLNDKLKVYKSGGKCNSCGSPIWVIGSAIVGWNGCFSCITGEAEPDDDYEIDEACK